MKKLTSKTCLVLAATLMLVSSTAGVVRAAEPVDGAAAQADQAVLLNAIRANRKALVAANLKLTDAEATKFWPIYERYQKDLDVVGDRLVAVIQDYTANFSSLSNEKAMKIVDEYLAVEADRVKVKRSYVEEFAKALPGRTVARLYQIENKMEALIRYDIASTIPVVDQEGGSPAK